MKTKREASVDLFQTWTTKPGSDCRFIFAPSERLLSIALVVSAKERRMHNVFLSDCMQLSSSEALPCSDIFTACSGNLDKLLAVRFVQISHENDHHQKGYCAQCRKLLTMQQKKKFAKTSFH